MLTGEDEMGTIKNILMVGTMLFLFMQSAKHPSLGEVSPVHHKVNGRIRLEADITFTGADEPGWIKTECIDCPKQVTNRSLWLDVDGFPDIAYGCEQLHTASYDGDNWHLATDDSLAHVGACLEPVIDQWGYPHLVYFNEERSTLMYAYIDASGWHFQTVDSAGAVVDGASLALDVQGQPHISYSRSLVDYPDVDFDLIYAYRVDGDWNTVMVDQPVVIPNIGAIYAHTGETSLLLDGQGNAHIGYVVDYNWDTGFPTDLMYAYQGDNTWTVELVKRFDGLVDYNDAYAMTLDGNGYPHFAYAEPIYTFYSVYSRVAYASRGAEGWENLIVDELNYGEINSISMVMSGNGYPHLIYPWGGSLKYTYQDRNGWDITTIAYADIENPIILLGKDGFPRISYNERSQDTFQEVIHLKYRYQDANGWYEQSVDSGGGDVGEFASLVLDESDRPHLSYYDPFNQDLKYACKESGTWHTKIIDQAVENQIEVGRWTSLALDDLGYPHISYIENIYCTERETYLCEAYLKYAFLDDSGWQTQTLDQGSIDDLYGGTSLALDRNGYPHITYLGEGGDLMYINLDASGWHTQTVAAYISAHSLALDQYGYAHITFSSWEDTGYALKYTYQDPQGWKVQTIESGEFYPVLLAMDRDGQPHISYISFMDSNSYLKYAYLDDNGWNIETITSWHYGGGVDSLVLDQDGYAHISYRLGPGYIGSPLYTFVPDYTLMYAYQDANGWNFEMIDRGKAVAADSYYGPYTSLALDNDGHPHLAYKKGKNLLYTFDQGFVWPSENWGYGLPGLSITYTLHVLNKNPFTDTFKVATSGSDWLTSIPGMVGPLAPAESAVLDVLVTIPATVTLGSTDTLTITVTSQSDQTKTGSVTLTTFAGYVVFIPQIAK